jgi:hypothetical protein
MAKLDTSRSALLTEDFLAIMEDPQVAATEQALNRIYALRLRKARYEGRITTPAVSLHAMQQAGWR